jgi:tetratricopeptide (TPR) repeat protein
MRFRVGIGTAILLLVPGALAQNDAPNDAKFDPAALRTKAKRYEREKFPSLAYRAYEKLARHDPKDRAAALSAARCAYEMRAYARARKHLEHASALKDSAAARALARKIEAGLERDARWEPLVRKELLPALLAILESGGKDAGKVRAVFDEDDHAQTRFLTRHIELKNAGGTIFAFVRTDSRDVAKRLTDHCLSVLEKAAKGWTAERAGPSITNLKGITFGNAVRRTPPLADPDPDIFLNVEWAFPVTKGLKDDPFTTNVARTTSVVCNLTFGRRKVRADDDARLRGFDDHVYTVVVVFDASALKPASR